MDALDLRVLAQLAAIQRNGQPGFVERVITLFLQTASNLIKDLEAASANNEFDTLYRASHAPRSPARLAKRLPPGWPGGSPQATKGLGRAPSHDTQTRAGLLRVHARVEAMQRDCRSVVPCCPLRNAGKDGSLRFSTELGGTRRSYCKRIQARRNCFEGFHLRR
jgi:hypothetical protein